MSHFTKLALPLVMLALCAASGRILADDDQQNELYAPAKAEDVQKELIKWAAGRGIKDKQPLEQMATLWSFESEQPEARVVFERAIAAFAVVDPEVRKLLTECRLLDAPLLAPEAQLDKVTQAAKGEEFFLANVRLFYARYLIRRRMYDMALDVYEDIDLKKVIDPAAALFYKSVCEHRLLVKKAGLETLGKLLHDTEKVPARFSTVATLMKLDLEALKEQTLDEVARKMSDVERRLDLARGGQRVRKEQDEIVATLDEIIKKIEQQQGGGGGSGGGQNQSSSPAGDSSIKGQTAPGEIDEKRIGSASGWGALPPKKAAKAKNLIDRNFPPHYRDAIRRYSKKLAGRTAKPGE